MNCPVMFAQCTVDLNGKKPKVYRGRFIYFFLKIHRAAQKNYRETPFKRVDVVWRRREGGISSAKSVGARGDGVTRPDTGTVRPPVYRHTNRRTRLSVGGRRPRNREDAYSRGGRGSGEDTEFIVFAGGRLSDYGGRGTCPAAEPKQLRVAELNCVHRPMLLFYPIVVYPPGRNACGGGAAFSRFGNDEKRTEQPHTIRGRRP